MDNGTSWSPSPIEDSDSDDQISIEQLEFIVKTILCLTGISAVVVNLKVFACFHWIRRPFSSVLKISLSLALADSCASCLSAVAIFSDNLMTLRTYIILDIIRLCFILVTVFHLLGLGFSHYIGIRSPLQHNSRLTQKSTSSLLILLWVIPSLFIICICTTEGGLTFWQAMIDDSLIEKYNKFEQDTTNRSFVSINETAITTTDQMNATNWSETSEIRQVEEEEEPLLERNHVQFIESFRFRMAIGSFVLISMVLIVFCYMWILIMIKHQRKVWKELSRTGSTVWRGGQNCRHIVSKEKTHEHNKIKGNFRAVYTTLIILGSCFLGWMPALLLYILTCSQDCLISGDLLVDVNENYQRHIILVRFFDNEMLLLKMIANPVIYSVRMKEIKEGTRRMHNMFMYRVFGRRCDSEHENHAKSHFKLNNDTCHSEVNLTSFKSTRYERGTAGRICKKRNWNQTTYL